MALIFLFLNCLFAIFLLYFCFAFVSGAPFVPSSNPTALSMIELANLQKGMTVYDLGSGDGKLLFLAAAKGAHAIGIEINPLLVIYTWVKTILTGNLGRVRATWKNFWHTDIQNADVVFIYLLPWRMERLQKKLQKELKPGALVVSNSFIFKNWKILRQDVKQHVYVFQKA